MTDLISTSFPPQERERSYYYVISQSHWATHPIPRYKQRPRLGCQMKLYYLRPLNLLLCKSGSIELLVLGIESKRSLEQSRGEFIRSLPVSNFVSSGISRS
ncbi:uncharacterized protein LOC106866846 isoform X2 [Brachypodium distachyon]|uniref:uncharacterized protein LOC106866846 isoform X2 n=1 Tax=Brachypodium distachyon TaxID=15368 RepID=UPI000D0CDAA6|nr:uncharacterized protein LOC106866846 isoform X2 [Brachypodium distachyon]|eukprot:XP_024313899.1 uncharacterized protein LOC106866846 isoform X2 [Brachypodium distachyon]